MKELAKHEEIASNGDVTSVPKEDVPDKPQASVLLPNLDSQRTYKVISPHLAHPEQAKDFVKEVIEETSDGVL